MSQPSYSRGRFQGRGRSGGRDGGRSSQRNPGRYEAAQAARVPVKSSEDERDLSHLRQKKQADMTMIETSTKKK